MGNHSKKRETVVRPILLKSLPNHKKQTTESTTKSTRVYFSGETLELTVQTTQENDIIYYINEHFPFMNTHCI